MLNISEAFVVHVFISQSFGGAEIYALELAARQREMGLRTAIWVAPNSIMYQEAKRKNLEVITEPLSHRIDFLSLPRVGNFIKNQKITHLHIHWSGGIWSFFGIKLWAQVKLIYHIHMWISHGKLDPLHWLTYGNLDQVIVAGERAKEQAKRLLPISNKKIEILKYAQDFSKVEATKNVGLDTFKKELGFKPSDQVIGVFARIDRQKGQKELLQAVLELLKSGISCKLLMVGDKTHGEKEAELYQNEIQVLLEDLKLKDHVKTFGFRKDYLNLMAICDVVVAPSYHESYSLVLLDAMALEKILITTNAGGSPDLVTEERGYLIEPRSSEAIFNVLTHVFLNQEEAKNKAYQAKVYVFMEHIYSVILEKLIKIYNLKKV